MPDRRCRRVEYRGKLKNRESSQHPVRRPCVFPLRSSAESSFLIHWHRREDTGNLEESVNRISQTMECAIRHIQIAYRKPQCRRFPPSTSFLDSLCCEPNWSHYIHNRSDWSPTDIIAKPRSSTKFYVIAPYFSNTCLHMNQWITYFICTVNSTLVLRISEDLKNIISSCRRRDVRRMVVIKSTH